MSSLFSPLKKVVLVAVPAALSVHVSLTACNFEPGGPIGGPCGPTRPDAVPADPGCIACLQADCNAQASAAFGPTWAAGVFSGGACGGYDGCVTGCKCNALCSAACTMGATCQGAMQDLDTCELTNCGLMCLQPMSASSSSTSSSSSSSSSSSTSSSSASSSTGGIATVRWACFLDSGPSQGDFTCHSAITPASSLPTAVAACAAGNGVSSNSCPNNGNLIGCCSVGNDTETCYYQGYQADETPQAQCAMLGWTWSATPLTNQGF